MTDSPSAASSNAASSNTERLVNASQSYADRFDRLYEPPTARPALKVAVVACMDARMPIFPMLGLSVGDAHILRNAGGLVTDDTIRSLCISQRFLGTEEIVLIHHTDCGLHNFDDQKFAQALEEETGQRPTWRAGGFDDPAYDVQLAARALKDNPFLLHREKIRGFVFDVHTGRLNEVDLAAP